jgi:hypothetical protein
MLFETPVPCEGTEKTFRNATEGDAVKHTIYLMIGLLAVIAGATLAGMTLAPKEAAAGFVSTATPTPAPQEIVRSATPTASATMTATHTPQPVIAATNTPVPPAPSATTPGGGAAGSGLKPPNTGNGPAGSAVNWLALGGAAMLILAGSGSLAVGARRRK